jgi:hypothetical protein
MAGPYEIRFFTLAGEPGYGYEIVTATGAMARNIDGEELWEPPHEGGARTIHEAERRARLFVKEMTERDLMLPNPARSSFESWLALGTARRIYLVVDALEDGDDSAFERALPDVARMLDDLVRKMPSPEVRFAATVFMSAVREMSTNSIEVAEFIRLMLKVAEILNDYAIDSPHYDLGGGVSVELPEANPAPRNMGDPSCPDCSWLSDYGVPCRKHAPYPSAVAGGRRSRTQPRKWRGGGKPWRSSPDLTPEDRERLEREAWERGLWARMGMPPSPNPALPYSPDPDTHVPGRPTHRYTVRSRHTGMTVGTMTAHNLDQARRRAAARGYSGRKFKVRRSDLGMANPKGLRIWTVIVNDTVVGEVAAPNRKAATKAAAKKFGRVDLQVRERDPVDTRQGFLFGENTTMESDRKLLEEADDGQGYLF